MLGLKLNHVSKRGHRLAVEEVSSADLTWYSFNYISTRRSSRRYGLGCHVPMVGIHSSTMKLSARARDFDTKYLMIKSCNICHNIIVYISPINLKSSRCALTNDVWWCITTRKMSEWYGNLTLPTTQATSQDFPLWRVIGHWVWALMP